uniref:USP domain-containing protein n=1 Tax=Leersia perrieri TaxID=77586 RepID=A0A0D9XA11_9ORYZ
MDEEKTSTRPREPGENSPRKASRLDMPAAIVPLNTWPEVRDPNQKAVAAAETSETDMEFCPHFGYFEDDMLAFMSQLRSCNYAPRCGHYMCENKVEKSSIFVCVKCELHFCIGHGNKHKPQGHARWHANLEQHYIFALFNEPEILYCMKCEQRMDMERDMEPESDSSDNSDTSDTKGCGHFLLGEIDFALTVSRITASTSVPVCQYHGCGITGKNRIMVCTGCNKHFCTRAETKKRPQGHARQHARQNEHWVGLWYSNPYMGYCFVCEFELNPGESFVEQGMVSGKEAFGQQSIVKQGMVSGKKAFGQQSGTLGALMVKGMMSGKGLFGQQSGTLGAPNVEQGMVSGKEAFGQQSGLVKGHGWPIKGIPNLGNTCYMNALLQCLFVLEKLRAKMLAPDAPWEIIGMALKRLFEDDNNVDNAQDTIVPLKFLACVRISDEKFVGGGMHDSHELLTFLRTELDKEEKSMMPAVATTVIDSIFAAQLSVTISCRRCPYSSASHEIIHDIQAPLPSKMPPPKSTASPPRNISCTSREKICVKLFPKVDMSNTEIVQAIAEGNDSHITGLELGDVAMEKTSEPLEVDSTEVEQSPQRKDGVHVLSQTPKDKVPGEIVQMPTKAGDLGQYDSAGIDNTSSEPEAKQNTFSVEGTAEDKGKAQCSDISGDNNSFASIEECLALHFEPELLEWKCQNCFKVDHHSSATSSKDGEQMMASTNENTIIDGDQTEQSDKIACQSEQSSSLGLECFSSRQPHGSDSQRQAMLTVDSLTEGNSTNPPVEPSHKEITSGMISDDNIAKKKTEGLEGVEETVPSFLPSDEPANQLIDQSQNASTIYQHEGKQVKLDHSADQVDASQKEQEDRNQGGIKTCRISKLPPVLTIQLKRNLGERGKVREHVSFEEILDVGPFMDPSSEDKDNSSYLLVGVIEHIGPSSDVGHWVAYVRKSRRQPDGGSSSWYCASDLNIREVSLEEVLSVFIAQSIQEDWTADDEQTFRGKIKKKRREEQM